jgi:glycosyltransferase involved in cell wall biosynthesis
MGPGFSVKKLVVDGFLWPRAMRMAERGRYDVVHAGEEAVFIAQRIKRARWVPYVYDMDSSIAQQLVEKVGVLSPMAWLFDRIEAGAIRGALACAPVCPALGELATRRGARHVEVLHDISQIDPDRPVPAAGIRSTLGLCGPVFMYVGNLEAYQGVELLVDGFALASARGVRGELVIVGGDERGIARVRERAARQPGGTRVFCVGPRPSAELGSVLREADVLVAPRVKGINTPMKVFPYLHSGKPVLLTRLPTHTQTFSDDVAMLAEPTPGAFAEAIERLAGDEALRARLGAAGRRFVEREHVWPAHLERVRRLYAAVERMIRAHGEAADGRGAADGRRLERGVV